MKLPPPARQVAERVSAWREERLAEPRHGERVAAVLGIALGVCFSVCFVTGLLSHLIQHPPSWFEWPSRPAGLYRVTQGLHVATGIAAVPLLFAKLWSVFPRLFTWPPARDVLHALERLSLLPLVGGAVFMLVTGVANIDLWYPWPFYFPAAHYAVAWVTIGALVVHIGAKASITRRALRRAEVAALPDVVRATAGVPRPRDRLVRRSRGDHGGSDVLTAAAPGAAGAAARRHRRAGLPGEPHRRRSGRRAGGHVAGLPVARRARTASLRGTSRSPSWPRCRSGRRRCRSRASKGGAPACAGRVCRCALVVDAAGVEGATGVEVVSLEERSRYRASFGERLGARRRRHAAGHAGRRRTAATSTTATRSASSHRTVPACSRRSGWPGWWCRERARRRARSSHRRGGSCPALVVGWALIGVGVSVGAAATATTPTRSRCCSFVVGFDLVPRPGLRPAAVRSAPG